jgi:uncharacterized membrane protein YbjE (DUF340 family)
MRSSLIIAAFFLSGLLLGRTGIIPEEVPIDMLMEWALYILMTIVGLAFGSDPRLKEMVISFRPGQLLLPLATIAGTIAGVLVLHLFVGKLSLADSLAIGSGFGYYSLSSILINNYSGEVAGTIALLANVSREILTLLLIPALVKYFGNYAPICSAGATSMDTTLPLIVRFTGKEFLVISMVHGIILTLLVPFIISLIYAVF